MEIYHVLRIDEQLYGCEELPEGQPVCCDVLWNQRKWCLSDR